MPKTQSIPLRFGEGCEQQPGRSLVNTTFFWLVKTSLKDCEKLQMDLDELEIGQHIRWNPA